MVDVFGLGGGAPDAAPQVSCEHQAGDRREEVGGSTDVGWRPDLQEEIQDARKSETGWHSSWEVQEACLEVRPDKNGALPDGTVPALGESSPDSPVLVVPVANTDEGPPPQGVPEVEGAAEDLVGGGVQGDGEREAAVEGARAFRRPDV